MRRTTVALRMRLELHIGLGSCGVCSIATPVARTPGASFRQLRPPPPTPPLTRTTGSHGCIPEMTSYNHPLLLTRRGYVLHLFQSIRHVQKINFLLTLVDNIRKGINNKYAHVLKSQSRQWSTCPSSTSPQEVILYRRF